MADWEVVEENSGIEIFTAFAGQVVLSQAVFGHFDVASGFCKWTKMCDCFGTCRLRVRNRLG